MYNRNLSATLSDSSDEDENSMSEIRFVPEDSAHCRIFLLFTLFY